MIGALVSRIVDAARRYARPANGVVSARSRRAANASSCAATASLSELRGHLRRSVHRRLRRVRMSAVVGTSVVMEIKAFDHVALWVTERDRLAALLTGCCAMHEIERTDDFTLVGGDARRGKLTLFDADGPRERGVLERVTLRVPDLEDARARLGAAGLELVERDGVACVDAVAELPLGLVAGDEPADLDHVVLRVRDPSRTASELESMGLDRENGALHAWGGKWSRRAMAAPRSQSALVVANHLGLRVDSADVVEDEARERGSKSRGHDAQNTLAVFLGADRVRLEFVEHKPFALASCMPDLLVAGAGMAGLVAAAQATEHGEDVSAREGRRAGGSMLLSSGVVWRYRDFDQFRLSARLACRSASASSTSGWTRISAGSRARRTSGRALDR